MRWAVRTEDTQDLGVVHVTFMGVDVVSFRFEQAWPRARFRHSKHFMPARYALEAVDDTRPVKIFKTVRASDGLQHAKPFWHRYFGSLSAELETIIDGCFTVAKNGLPMRPIFQRNHPSHSGTMLVLSNSSNALIDYLTVYSPSGPCPRTRLLFVALSRIAAPSTSTLLAGESDTQQCLKFA